MSADKRNTLQLVAENRKARFEYHIEEVFEAGLVLLGSEVKSLRSGRATLGEGWVRLQGGEAFLSNVHIPPYEQANRQNHEPLRERKLLLGRRELERLSEGVQREGRTVIPLQLHFRDGRAKLQIGLAVGKKLHDKREDQKQKDASRDIARALRRG